MATKTPATVTLTLSIDELELLDEAVECLRDQNQDVLDDPAVKLEDKEGLPAIIDRCTDLLIVLSS